MPTHPTCFYLLLLGDDAHKGMGKAIGE
jgi:hypothetical protein